MDVDSLTGDEHTAGIDFHNPQISGCGSFTGSPTVMMPLGGSVLNWVWEKPLGLVFDGICSGG